MKGKFIIGVVAGSIAGVTASMLLMDQFNPGLTARMMRNGRKMVQRYRRML